jgi:helicase-like protein/SNF2 domain-containing protein
VPAALKGEWRRACDDAGVPLVLCSHTQLARGGPALASGATLILVDEAHAFRNPSTRRYAALADLTAGRRVALLTATPFNNAPADLSSLVLLFAGRDRFRELGVADLPSALRSPERGDAALALAAVSVCRSRRLVRERFPQLDTAFPRRRLAPIAEYDLGAVYAGALEALLDALERLSGDFGGPDRGGALFHLALLRRLESSRAALLRSLRRHRAFLLECSDAVAGGRRMTHAEFRRLFPRRDDDDTQLSLLPLLMENGPALPRDDLEERHAALDRALELVGAAEPAADPKVVALDALLAGELSGRRTIVFTEYRDTALYLARVLRRRRRVLTVTGDTAWAGRERLSRCEALDAFAPLARGARPDPLLEADVLVATDVASEGMNLQDASAVVNYDLPWNPVRVMQRIGRVDRLGARHHEAVVAHLLPAGGLRQMTGVLERLRSKLAAGTRALGIEPDPVAALWWVGRSRPLPSALEVESWRRVEPFEAAERWRMTVGPRSRPTRLPPLISAGLLGDLDEPAAGILLALEWANGARIPLAYVVTANGEQRADPLALGDLAARSLRAAPLPAAPADFSCVLASVLPDARARLVALSAARRGAEIASAGRRLAVSELTLAAHRADRTRNARAAALAARALAALRHEMPAGLERRLGRLLRDGARGDDLAARVTEQIAPALRSPGPALEGTPRLVLVAAIALAGRCPSA